MFPKLPFSFFIILPFCSPPKAGGVLGFWLVVGWFFSYFLLTIFQLTSILFIIMTIADFKGFIDLGGVFILAFVLLQQWSVRFNAIEDKMTRIIALLCLAIQDKVPVSKIEEILTKQELEVVKPTP